MDDSSPDEREFPGLYEKKKQDENESNSSENFEKIKKSAKKEKDKKLSYEALGVGSESENEDPDTGSKLFRSPSKKDKKKTFKFPVSAKKEKREKSREPDDKKLKEKHKIHKEKDNKKDKKDKTSKAANDSFELGDIQPIFGVSLGLAVERSKCHDGVKLPLVVRNCIDYLQENLQSEQIYKAEGVKSRIQNLKKSYNNREDNSDDFDVPTASSLLKAYLQDLPEPILTTELITRFEEVSALPDVTQQAQELEQLIDQLPKCNQVLLGYLARHFSAVINNGKSNNLNAQSMAVLLSPILLMSHRLFVVILCHAETLFADVELKKYVPPINSSTSPNLPETAEDIQFELRKQESLLSQIHSEMNAGFVTKKREEELWETTKIITQLKRKLRTFEKKHDMMQKSLDTEAIEENIDFTLRRPDDEAKNVVTTCDVIEEKEKEKSQVHETNVHNVASVPTTQEQASASADKIVVGENGLLMLPKDHPDYVALIRLQLENQELMNWKQSLQAKINAERAEYVRLKRQLESQQQIEVNEIHPTVTTDDPEYEMLCEQYMKENSLLEQKRILLAKEIVEENLSLIQLQVELALKQIIH